MWRIEYTDVGEEAILRLDKPVRERILFFMRDRVGTSENPKVLAETLTRELRGLYRFRVRDYRVICDIQQVVRVVEVPDVRHRSKIYRRSGY